MTVTPSLRRFVGLLPITLALGCGSSGGNRYSLDVGSDDGGPSLVLGAGDASVLGAFDAHIEQNHIAVTFVTLSCTGPCADVVAVPTGGQAPYTFKWNDGSTSASHHVCPTTSTSYFVKVTDTGRLGELARPAETVQVPLAANVVACPDGGASDAQAPLDSGLSGCVTLTTPILVTASWCFTDAAANPGSFALPFPIEAGGDYTMTLNHATNDGSPPLVTLYALTGTCLLDPLGTLSTQSSTPQSACLHPQQTLSTLASDALSGGGLDWSVTLCRGCSAP